MSQRDMESALEKALGQCVVSQHAVSDMTDRLPHAYEAFRTRDLSGFDLAYLFMDTVYEPLRRWGKKQLSEFEQHQSRALRQSFGRDHPLVPLDRVTKERNPRRSAASAG
jgi:hypothetical protein